MINILQNIKKIVYLTDLFKFFPYFYSNIDKNNYLIVGSKFYKFTNENLAFI
jgi:hypothetical protein